MAKETTRTKVKVRYLARTEATITYAVPPIFIETSSGFQQRAPQGMIGKFIRFTPVGAAGLFSAKYEYVLLPDNPNYWAIREAIEGKFDAEGNLLQAPDDSYSRGHIFTEEARRASALVAELAHGAGVRRAYTRELAALRGKEYEALDEELKRNKVLTSEIQAMCTAEEAKAVPAGAAV